MGTRIDDDSWPRIAPLLDRIIELPPAEQASMLREVRASDPGVARLLESLLAADGGAGSFLEQPASSYAAELLETDDAEPPSSFVSLEQLAVTWADSQERTGAEGRTVQIPDGSRRTIADYEILRELGSGGMGTVFEAHQRRMNRKVALKVMSRRLSFSDKSNRRFRREAWIAGKLSHPNLVRVFEHGQTEDLSYYSMEFVSGGSLHDVISSMKQWGRDERIGIEFGTGDYVNWAIRRVIEAATGLHHAHRNGVVHRDVKPMNLMLTEETAAVKVTDFGIARDEEASRMTTAGQLMGTLAYMAPEQILGQQDRIDARTDVYALGVTLFELLTLDRPFVGDTQELYMNAVLTSEARRASRLNQRVSRDLEVVIGKALEKSPERRYVDAEAFARDLENVLRFRPIEAQPPTPWRRTWKWVRRRPVHAALIGVLIAGIPTVGLLARRAVEHRRLVQQGRIDELRDEARIGMEHGEHARVVELTTELLGLVPGDIHALLDRALASMQLALAGAGERVDLERRALDDISQVVATRNESSWPYRWQAFMLRQFGRETDAAVADELARRFRTDETVADDLYWDGKLAFESGDYERAEASLTRVIAGRPDHRDSLQMRALAREESGDLDRAIEDHRSLAALSPDDFYYKYNLGRALTERGDLVEGEAFLEAAQGRGPERHHVYSALAHNHLEQGRVARNDEDEATAADQFERAQQAARRAIELDPQDAWAHVNLGASLVERQMLEDRPDPRRVDEALTHYTTAVARWDEAPAGRGDGRGVALINICDALIRGMRLDAAVGPCREATVALPGSPIAFYNLAGLHALRGETDDAIAALERDLELGDVDWGYLDEDPWFESMRDDVRLRDLVSRMRAASR